MTAPPTGRLVIRAARVFAANGTAPIRDGIVVIEGDRIVEVRPAGALETEQLVGELVEYPTGTVIPGMIDAHTHISLAGDRRTYEAMAADPDEMMALAAVANLRRHLKAGVTTMRDNGARNRVTFVVREAMRRGYITGPRLLLAGRPITHSSGHFHWCNGVADGEVQIRAAVRQLVAEGADHIKLMASGGATAGNLPYYASYTAQELRAAVETAHGLGRLTTAHCRSRDSMENAVQAGLDCMEHAEFLIPAPMTEYGRGTAASGVMSYDAALLERILDAGIFISFTLQAGGYDTLVALRSREPADLSSDQRIEQKGLEDYYEMKLATMAAMLRDGAGDRLVISSDAGPFDVQFGRFHYNLDLAVAAGMSPQQALEATTSLAARACGVSDRVGTIEAGKMADLVVVDGDPLENIENAARVISVYLGGVLAA